MSLESLNAIPAGMRVRLNEVELFEEAGRKPGNVFSRVIDWASRSSAQIRSNKNTAEGFVYALRLRYGDDVGQFATRQLRAHLSKGRPLSKRRVDIILRQVDQRADQIEDRALLAALKTELEFRIDRRPIDEPGPSPSFVQELMDIDARAQQIAIESEGDEALARDARELRGEITAKLGLGELDMGQKQAVLKAFQNYFRQTDIDEETVQSMAEGRLDLAGFSDALESANARLAPVKGELERAMGNVNDPKGQAVLHQFRQMIDELREDVYDRALLEIESLEPERSAITRAHSLLEEMESEVVGKDREEAVKQVVGELKSIAAMEEDHRIPGMVRDEAQALLERFPDMKPDIPGSRTDVQERRKPEDEAADSSKADSPERVSARNPASVEAATGRLLAAAGGMEPERLQKLGETMKQPEKARAAIAEVNELIDRIETEKEFSGGEVKGAKERLSHISGQETLAPEIRDDARWVSMKLALASNWWATRNVGRKIPEVQERP